MFEKVKEPHILQGIRDYESNGLPKGFGLSTSYDLVFEENKYPPKAIMAYAHYHAEGSLHTKFWHRPWILSSSFLRAHPHYGFPQPTSQGIVFLYHYKISKVSISQT